MSKVKVGDRVKIVEGNRIPINFPDRLVKLEEQVINLEIQETTPELKEQALRYNSDKLPFDELDPLFLEEMFKVIQYGQKKYARLNWLKGAPATQFFGCIMRHMLQWWKGEEIDAESGISHLSHVACNIMMLQYNLRKKPENDDRIFK